MPITIGDTDANASALYETLLRHRCIQPHSRSQVECLVKLSKIENPTRAQVEAYLINLSNLDFDTDPDTSVRLLGDVLGDEGPNDIWNILLLAQLVRKNKLICHIMGNHEAMFLSYYLEEKAGELPSDLDTLKKIPTSTKNLINTLRGEPTLKRLIDKMVNGPFLERLNLVDYELTTDAMAVAMKTVHAAGGGRFAIDSLERESKEAPSLKQPDASALQRFCQTPYKRVCTIYSHAPITNAVILRYAQPDILTTDEKGLLTANGKPAAHHLTELVSILIAIRSEFHLMKCTFPVGLKRFIDKRIEHPLGELYFKKFNKSPGRYSKVDYATDLCTGDESVLLLNAHGHYGYQGQRISFNHLNYNSDTVEQSQKPAISTYSPRRFRSSAPFVPARQAEEAIRHVPTTVAHPEVQVAARLKDATFSTPLVRLRSNS